VENSLEYVVSSAEMVYWNTDRTPCSPGELAEMTRDFAVQSVNQRVLGSSPSGSTNLSRAASGRHSAASHGSEWKAMHRQQQKRIFLDGLNR
jgi:hypothetical protein